MTEYDFRINDLRDMGPFLDCPHELCFWMGDGIEAMTIQEVLREARNHLEEKHSD